jgi:hypothetical protein
METQTALAAIAVGGITRADSRTRGDRPPWRDFDAP